MDKVKEMYYPQDCLTVTFCIFGINKIVFFDSLKAIIVQTNVDYCIA